MQSVFSVDQDLSAAALAVIVLISIPISLVAGRWTAASGPRTPFLVSAAGGCRPLAVAGRRRRRGAGHLRDHHGRLPLFELNAATCAAVTSPIGAGGGQGAMGAAMALGAIIAGVMAGWFAIQFGFASLAAITLAAAGAALLIGLIGLRPVSDPAS